MGALETNTTLIYGVHIRESANDGSDFTNAAADYRVLFLGEDGQLHVKDSGGSVTDIGTGGSLGAWTDYTPVLTGSVSNPVLGSSTLTGRYKELDANTLAFHWVLTITTGGAWNAGSGNWLFSLPSGVTSANRRQVVPAHVLDSGTTHFSCTAMIANSSTTTSEIYVADATGSKILTNSVPVTWATGDIVEGGGIIEIA